MSTSFGEVHKLSNLNTKACFLVQVANQSRSSLKNIYVNLVKTDNCLEYIIVMLHVSKSICSFST